VKGGIDPLGERGVDAVHARDLFGAGLFNPASPPK